MAPAPSLVLVALVALLATVQSAPLSLTATNSTSGNKASRRLLWQPVDDRGNVFTKPEQQMVQLTDPAVMERGWPRILDRLRVGGPGADIRHAVWWTHPLSGRCQSKTSLGNCNEEALELLLDDIHGMLGWWYNPVDQHLSVDANRGNEFYLGGASIDTQFKDKRACLHIWDGQAGKAPPPNGVFKAYVALCDKEWASNGDALKMKLRPSMTALVWERTPTFLIESVSQPNFCLSLNPVDEYVKFMPCDDNSPDQKWYTSQNPFDSNDRNPLTGADVGDDRTVPLGG